MLAFRKTDTTIEITGKTFYAKEAIKSAGGTWNAEKRCWTLSTKAGPEILKALEDAAVAAKKKEKDAAKAERLFAKSPEGIAKRQEDERQRILWCLEQKKLGHYNWICCEKVTVIDWERQHTSCMACAEWGGQSWNAFRVRGSIFTGD